MPQPRPIDMNRAGRLILAYLDRRRDDAESVVAEALSEGTFPELFDTVSGGLLGLLRLSIGDDNIRQWASDWVLHARLTAAAEHSED